MNINNAKKLLNLAQKADKLERNYTDCIEYAIQQLENGSNDINLSILAGLDPNDYFEVRNYIERIIVNFNIKFNEDSNDWIGEYINELYLKYLNGSITLKDLDIDLWKVFSKLDYPDWMSTLCYNSEYAADIDGYLELFEKEFEYINEIWEKAATIDDFLIEYNPEVSKNNRG